MRLYEVWGPRVGPITQKFELMGDFCTVHLATTFHHAEVIVLTDKQTHKETIGHR